MSKQMQGRIQSKIYLFYLLPFFGWVFFFVIIPLVIIGIYSFSTKGIHGEVIFQFQVGNYLQAFDWTYLKIFWNSIKLATFTGILCLLISYPMAYKIARSAERWKPVFLILIVLPFWINFIVRAYASRSLFGDFGFINQVLLNLGLVKQPISFLSTKFSVGVGMLTNYLPFMIFPIYLAIEKFDFDLIEAARDLGANSWSILYRILIPLTWQGIMTGFIFVFVPSLGEFVIPELLGGAKTMFFGNLITEQFLRMRNWPFGSALSLLLIGFLIAILLIHFAFLYSSREK